MKKFILALSLAFLSLGCNNNSDEAKIKRVISTQINCMIEGDHEGFMQTFMPDERFEYDQETIAIFKSDFHKRAMEKYKNFKVGEIEFDDSDNAIVELEYTNGTKEKFIMIKYHDEWYNLINVD